MVERDLQVVATDFGENEGPLDPFLLHEERKVLTEKRGQPSAVDHDVGSEIEQEIVAVHGPNRRP